MFRFYSPVEKDQDGNPIPSQLGRVVVAGQYADGVLKIAVSHCSNKDRYIKKKGRAIADGRISSTDGRLLYTTINMENCTMPEFVNIAKQIVQRVQKDKRTVGVNDFTFEPLPQLQEQH